jgi:hypothetical protein
LRLARLLDIQLTVSNHDFPYTMSCKDLIGVHMLSKNNPNLFLQFVVNVLSIVGANILYKLFPMGCAFDLLQTFDHSQTHLCQDWYTYLSLLHWLSQYNYDLVLNRVHRDWHHHDRVHRDRCFFLLYRSS